MKFIDQRLTLSRRLENEDHIKNLDLEQHFNIIEDETDPGEDIVNNFKADNIQAHQTFEILEWI